MRAVRNQFRDPGMRPSPPDPGVRAFHRTLPGYEVTPLVHRPALAKRLGLKDLYVKYEGTRFGLMAFKGLGGSWALHRLLQTRRGRFDTVATASEGNHGRAVAWAARLMKVPCVIFLPARAAPERVANIRGEGARVVMVDGSYEDAVRACDEESRTRGWQVVSDVGYEGYMEIPPVVVEGYATLYQEVDEQLTANGLPAPGVVLVPGGVGGILHAAVDHLRRDGGGPTLIGVEPFEANCLTASLASADGMPASATGTGRTGMACLNCAEVSLPSWPPIRAGVDAMLAIDDRFAEEGVRLLHHAEDGDQALAAGTSGAATTGGLLALTQSAEGRALADELGVGAGTVALVVCTEGAIDRAAFDRIVAADGPLPPRWPD